MILNTKSKLTLWLSEQPDIHFAVLFGSFAKQTQNSTSDIDLAIELKHPLSADKKLTLLQSLLDITDRTIDLIDIKTIGQPLLNEIIQHGELLKGSPQDLIELSIKNINMMQDFTPYIKRTLKQRRERLLS